MVRRSRLGAKRSNQPFQPPPTALGIDLLGGSHKKADAPAGPPWIPVGARTRPCSVTKSYALIAPGCTVRPGETDLYLAGTWRSEDSDNRHAR
ncbi:hypothetical protein DIPPA_32559 [Diplonema papillatum]|nr:hypothetical protein DIPPA_32559 [Diplonema papillatum]